ncbi:MarR family winged helix-turn-helix transcriptional regulator [Microbacterium sp. BWT-B31]|uniref:MarR family winged helix-turn-helix transcriptional regulator n=1 Tax=Microbacterium sp. BWT-B31 TaxID=3232072 RepID=UPI00352913EB
MARDITSTELAVFERLIDVGRRWERRSDKLLRERQELTFVQYQILITLRNRGGELRMRELAESLVVGPSALTYQLKQLEARHLAVRATAPDDERGVVAQLTVEGLNLIADLFRPQNDLIHDAVVSPLEPGEVETLHYLLGKLQISMRGVATGGLLPGAVPFPSRLADAERIVAPSG